MDASPNQNLGPAAAGEKDFQNLRTAGGSNESMPPPSRNAAASSSKPLAAIVPNKEEPSCCVPIVRVTVISLQSDHHQQ